MNFQELVKRRRKKSERLERKYTVKKHSLHSKNNKMERKKNWRESEAKRKKNTNTYTPGQNKQTIIRTKNLYIKRALNYHFDVHFIVPKQHLVVKKKFFFSLHRYCRFFSVWNRQPSIFLSSYHWLARSLASEMVISNRSNNKKTDTNHKQISKLDTIFSNVLGIFRFRYGFPCTHIEIAITCNSISQAVLNWSAFNGNSY